ncbi:MAG: VOC family protein [Pseudomonadota bacterium]
MHPFHLAIPVAELDGTRAFYCDVLGLGVGREDAHWLDLDFFGHQVTLHVAVGTESLPTNEVDGKDVPVRHFGIVLPVPEWQALADRLRSCAVDFLIEPCVRFAGEPGEQHTMFVRDPSGNVLEFKSFADRAALFRRD